MAEPDDMPCGECDMGTYSEAAALNQKARRFGALCEKDRWGAIPKCKKFNRPCNGAVDYHQFLIELDESLGEAP